MSKLILHISDLHVTRYTGADGKVNSKINSYLTTRDNDEASNHFVNTFIKEIKKDFPDSEYYLLVTGDISNEGEKIEFTFATKFLAAITSELKIAAERILVLPGDHDIHRRSLANELDERPTNESHLLNSIKLKNFASFYNDVKGQDFQFDKLIVDHILIQDKVVLIGLNSNYKIDLSGGDGFIPIEKFKGELEALKKLLPSDVQLIACWHHNITAGYENKNSGQWEVENRQHLLAELESQNVKLVLTGNEHTNSVKSILLNTLWTSDAGAFSAVDNDTTFKVYPMHISREKISLENKTYALQKTNGNDQSYFWDARSNVASAQPEEFVLFEKNNQIITDVLDLPHIKGSIVPQRTPETVDEFTQENVRIYYDNPSISDSLYSIIKEKKLFHSGHFHWSESSRAHNWIDVSKLLEDGSTLYFVQNAIIDIIDKFNLAERCDLIIGLGYEGNIISSKASIKYNIPYTSLPYSYRYNDHHEYEKKLNYDNRLAEFKTVIIITDVVNDGRTIRKLIAEKEKEFFDKVDKIIVLSLFYTGHREINIDILNYQTLPKDYDIENDHEVNNIEFYTIKYLPVERCPYGSNYKDECFIYKDGLSFVHLFYAE